MNDENRKYDYISFLNLLAEAEDIAAEKTYQERIRQPANWVRDFEKVVAPESRSMDREELDEIRTELAWITQEFSARLPPDPNQFRPELDAFQTVAETLYGNGINTDWANAHIDNPNTDLTLGPNSPMAEAVSAVPDLMQNWNGNAAHAFQANLVDSLGPVIANTTDLSCAIWTVYHGLYCVYRASQDKLMSIAEAMKRALEDLPAEPDNSGLFTMIGGITTVLAGVATIEIPGVGMTGIAAGFTMIAGASTYASAGAEGHQPVGGDSVAEVLDNAAAALKEYDETLTQQEQKMEAALTANLIQLTNRPCAGRILSGTQDSVQIVVSRPERLLDPDPDQDLTADGHFVPDTMWD